MINKNSCFVSKNKMPNLKDKRDRRGRDLMVV